MKRYIVLLLSVTLLFSSLASSVSATPLLFPETKTDFIKSAVEGYQLYHDGVYTNLVAPTFNFDSQSTTERYSLRFSSVPTNLYIDKLHVLISAPTRPSIASVYFDQDQLLSLSYLGTYLSNGDYSTSTNNIYEYICYPSDTLKGMLQFEFAFPTNTSGSFSFLACDGYTVDGFSVGEFDVLVNGSFAQAYSHVETLFSGNNVSVPYFNSYYYNRDNNDAGYFEFSNCFLTVDFLDIGRVQYIDKLYFKLRSISQPYDFAVSLLDSTGNIATALPAERISAWSQSTFSSSASMQYIDTVFEIDLNDYNLDSSSIQLCFSMDPQRTGDSDNYFIDGIVLSVQDIAYKLPTSDLPWYSLFFNGISNLFRNLGNSISTGFSSVGTWFTDMKNSVVSGFNSVVNLLDMLVNGDQEASDQFAQQGQQAEDSLGQASDVLGSVQKPDITPDNLFDQYLNYNTSGLAVLSMITSNSYITDMLVLVFTFALAGFIFYGKKG